MSNKEIVYEDNTVIDSIILDDNKNIIYNYKKNENEHNIYNEEDNQDEEDLSIITKKMVDIEEEVYSVYLILDKYREENKCVSDILKYVELKDVYKLIYPDYEGIF
jgi:predicted acetyltransferase